MKVKAFRDTSTSVTINGYIVRNFAWTTNDPNNILTARLIVTYDLVAVGEDGAVTPSPLPEHRNITVELRKQDLIEWLETSGKPGDLQSFDYHDIERLVQKDAKRRFSLNEE